MFPEPQVDIFIPARLDSTRLPRKQLREVRGQAMLSYLVDRMQSVSEANHVVLLTTNRSVDDELEKWVQKSALEVFRGSEHDVLQRFYKGAQYFDSDLIVRANGDNPLLSSEVTEDGIKQILEHQLEFVTGKNRYTDLPVGIGPEVLTRDLLELLASTAKSAKHREHVTSFIFENPDEFEWAPIEVQNQWKASDVRLTVDTDDDLETLRKIIHKLPEGPPDSWSIPMIIETYRSEVDNSEY